MRLIVMTGLSGSGKIQPFAFDTIYADGQRRYMESLSSYARQFLGQMEKPECEPRSPAFRLPSPSTRRPPATTHVPPWAPYSEIYDYLRLMYARIGVPHCPICGRRSPSGL